MQAVQIVIAYIPRIYNVLKMRKFDRVTLGLLTAQMIESYRNML